MARLRPGHKPVAIPVEITDLRELSRADLAHLTTKREPNSIAKIRDNHHRIARAIASGMTNYAIAETCGISIGRISVLRADPSMIDLISHYRSMIDAEWVGQDAVVEYMKSNALKAQAMISDKLDDAAEKNEFLPTRDLLGIAELGLDRTGYGKVNKNLNINVDFAAKLEEARNRSARARATQTIEGEATSQPAPAALPRSEGDHPVAPQRSMAPLPPKFRRV